MRDVYIFEYLNEIEFKKCERSVKKYNMFAFKKLIFDFYPEMKEGNFLGKIVNEDEDSGVTSYELVLPTDDLFVKVHGEIILHYDVQTKHHKCHHVYKRKLVNLIVFYLRALTILQAHLCLKYDI